MYIYVDIICDRVCINLFFSSFIIYIREVYLTERLVAIENFNFFCRHLARGNISQNSSGVLVALLEQAQKLEPQSGSPIVILETSKKYSIKVI